MDKGAWWCAERARGGEPGAAGGTHDNSDADFDRRPLSEASDLSAEINS